MAVELARVLGFKKCVMPSFQLTELVAGWTLVVATQTFIEATLLHFVELGFKVLEFDRHVNINLFSYYHEIMIEIVNLSFLVNYSTFKKDLRDFFRNVICKIWPRRLCKIWVDILFYALNDHLLTIDPNGFIFFVTVIFFLMNIFKFECFILVTQNPTQICHWDVKHLILG